MQGTKHKKRRANSTEQKEEDRGKDKIINTTQDTDKTQEMDDLKDMLKEVLKQISKMRKKWSKKKKDGPQKNKKCWIKLELIKEIEKADIKILAITETKKGKGIIKLEGNHTSIQWRRWLHEKPGRSGMHNTQWHSTNIKRMITIHRKNIFDNTTDGRRRI